MFGEQTIDRSHEKICIGSRVHRFNERLHTVHVFLMAAASDDKNKLDERLQELWVNKNPRILNEGIDRSLGYASFFEEGVVLFRHRSEPWAESNGHG